MFLHDEYMHLYDWDQWDGMRLCGMNSTWLNVLLSASVCSSVIIALRGLGSLRRLCLLLV